MTDRAATRTTVSGAAPTEIRSAGVRSLLLWFDEIGAHEGNMVGGKAASLAELRRTVGTQGVRVPDGFATTVEAYQAFLDAPLSASGKSELLEALRRLGVRISGEVLLREILARLFEPGRVDDELALHDRSAIARRACLATEVPAAVRSAVEDAYRRLCCESDRLVDVAVRSSATREDSAEASFAGQYESFLNVRGVTAVVDAWRRCAASAFTERVVAYQMGRGWDPREGSVAVVVQRMVRSDLAASGVAFTLDPDSGNRNVIVVTAAYGLGEPVVQGAVSPDTYVLWKEGIRRGTDALVDRTLGSKEVSMVYAGDGDATSVVPVDPKRQREWTLSPAEVEELGRQALIIESHYGRPMDIEWAKDGQWGAIFIVQARPETVHAASSVRHGMEVFTMDPGLAADLKSNGQLRAKGQSVGSRIATGRVRRYERYEDVIDRERRLRVLVSDGRDVEDLDPRERVFDAGDVLVTEMTTPDWEPLMKKASLILTEKGGRTSHAAIVAREFGIPAIVGCGDDLRSLDPLTEVTGTCAEGDMGYVFEGAHPFEVQRVEPEATEGLKTQIKLNVGFPDRALRDAMLPSDGVGLARLEFIITSRIGIHPTLLAHYERLRHFVDSGAVDDSLAPFEERLRTTEVETLHELLTEVERRTPSPSKRSFFVDRLRSGVARICAAFHPRPVLVRLSDLKSNEYRELLGGHLFEPAEENPMIAWRGAARYTDPRFRDAFAMECEALADVRTKMGLDNLQVMVPFCRTPEEGREVVELLEGWGLTPSHGVPLFLMVELPSNVIDADRFIDEMTLSGGSMGTNDLVQTVYALSRDDLGGYGNRVDARSTAVRAVMSSAVRRFRSRGLEIGICGQAPSDHPDEIPPFLVEVGISSISVTADSLLRVRESVRRAEVARAKDESNRTRPLARGA